MAANKEHKDRLFVFIFGSEENREFTLSLYNAINQSHHTDAQAIQITTIGDILYLGMRNDISFIISDQMNLFEHQSTFNPNMPVRLLQYVGHLYEQYIVKNDLYIYGKKIVMLPVPKLVVFYNGQDEKPDEMLLKLSNSFPENADSDIEVKVRMLNINYGKNKALMDACSPLREYAWFIEKIRHNESQGMATLEAIDNAITDTPESFILSRFLRAHRAEVKGMLMQEYDEAKIRNMSWEEGREQGREEGREQGRFEILFSQLEDGMITPEYASKKLGMELDEFINEMEKFKADRAGRAYRQSR